MNVNEIKYYFDPEQLNSYDVSWWKTEQAFKEIREVYADKKNTRRSIERVRKWLNLDIADCEVNADTEYAKHLIESTRKWLNLGITDREGNAQYYSMTQDGDKIFVFLQSFKDGDRTSDIKEFSSFEEAQEFVANHLRTEASYIEDARYRVADEASLFAMRDMVKNLKPFYF